MCSLSEKNYSEYKKNKNQSEHLKFLHNIYSFKKFLYETIR